MECGYRCMVVLLRWCYLNDSLGGQVYFTVGVDTCHIILIDLAGPLQLDSPPPAGLPFFGLPCNGTLTSYSSFHGVTLTMCLPFHSTVCSSQAFPCCAQLAPLAASFHACAQSRHMPWTPTPWVRQRWLVSPICRPNAGGSLGLVLCSWALGPHFSFLSCLLCTYMIT